MKRRKYKKRNQRRNKKSALRLKSLLGTTGFVAFVGALVIAPKVWTEVCSHLPVSVQHLEVLGTSSEVSTEIQDLLTVAPGSPLFGSWISATIKKLESHPRIQQAKISRQLNGKVTLQLTEKEPEALVSADKLYEFDATGRVLGTVPQSALARMDRVVVTGSWASLSDVEERTESLREALEVKEALVVAGILEKDISEIHWDVSRGWEIYLVGSSVRFTLGTKDFFKRARRLEKIWEDMGPHLAKIREVDLGFENRAIVKVYEELSL